ncbi:hypothetical protein [Streptomyces adelaidensis]|uniref:hypothetical protein n=1 Tax=Streptomyces adelaidensis TaxID=2796465 RepID=UPI0019065605|nr:hypothetical protein [Streptomyces adelaidensis]
MPNAPRARTSDVSPPLWPWRTAGIPSWRRARRWPHGPFPADVTAAFATAAFATAAFATAAFAAKYDWDVTAPHAPGEPRVLREVPVRRRLLAGTAQ